MNTPTKKSSKIAKVPLVVGLIFIWGIFTIFGVMSDEKLANIHPILRVVLVTSLMILGPGCFALGAYRIGKDDAARSLFTHTDLSTRITTLASQLTGSLELISSIEQEVKARQQLVEQLESQKKIGEAAVSLTKSQVDALAQLLNIEIQKGDRRSAARDYILFTAGIFVSLIITIILKAFGL